jgi:hypothetical protein
MDYVGTALERWQDYKDNPALYHFVYPPFLLILSLPFEAAGQAIGFYDQRVVHLLFYVGLLLLLHRPLKDHPFGVAAAALIALNPWFGPFVVGGRNDVVLVFWAVAAWRAMVSGHRMYAWLLLGMGIATKTFFLVAAPFVVAAHRREWAPCAALLLAPLLMTSLPFLVNDAPSFLEDVFGAPAGLGDHPFEIRGWGSFGFANLVLALGLVRSPSDYFPFSIFQFAALLPCAAYGGRSVLRDGGFGNVLLWSSVAIFAVLFFGRFIHDNYIGTLLSLVVISQGARESPTAARSTPSVA